MKLSNIQTINKINEQVLLCGWVNTIRKMGKIIFIDLRDRSGIIQVVISPLEIIKGEFDREIDRTCSEAQKLGYNPVRFLQMMNKYGAIGTSKRLLAKQDYIQDGVVKLWKLGRLDLSMEAIVLQYQELFTEEGIKIAKKRLEDLNFNIQNISLFKFPIIKSEYILEIEGIVQKRGEKQVNKEMPTGEVEVLAKSVKILSEAETPPFEIDNEERQAGEELRLKYRYLDLRHERMKKNIKIRHEVIKAIREFFYQEDFWEIETPYLSKSTPEGARDFLVPSRNYPRKFYALPQSPQQYKQMLMVAGLEKYFQIVRCFRDEDQRGDRQAEFTQLDVEMSFVDEEEIFGLIERLVKFVLNKVVVAHHDAPHNAPFLRMTYQEAMKKYQSDKPDIRKDKSSPEEFAFLWVTDFPMFKYKEGDKRWAAAHHPFTAINPEDLPLLKKGPSDKIRALQYDLVLNGSEIAGGSIRTSDPKILHQVFKVLGHSEKEIKEKFGHLLEAFKYGVPPHGGIAFGLDRFIAILCGEQSIREVMAFPKTTDNRDPLMDAPSSVEKEQLDELGIKLR